MPQHRRLNVKKFLDSLSESLIREYFSRFFEGQLQLDACDSASVMALMDTLEDEALKSTIREDFGRINDISETVMNHLVKAARTYGVEIMENEPRESLAMRVFLFHPVAYEYSYDKFCIFNAENKVSEHNVTATDLRVTPEKLDAFKSRISDYYATLAKGQECIVRHHDENDRTYIVVFHGSYRRSVPTWDGHEIRTLFFRPATEDVLIYDKKAGTLLIKAPYRRDKENYIKTFTEVIVEDGNQATRPDRDSTYTLEPLRNGTFSFAGNEYITGVTLLEVKMSLNGTTSPEVALKSPDLLRTLKDDVPGRITLDSGDLLHAKFRFNIKVEGKPRRVTFVITPPNVTNLHRKKYADLIGAYLKEFGVKLV